MLQSKIQGAEAELFGAAALHTREFVWGALGWEASFLNQHGVQALLVALLCPARSLEIQGRHFLDSATILILGHIYIYNPPYHIHSIIVYYIFLNGNKLQGYI